MTYTIQDLVERSGLAPRTIRTYCERRLIPRPRGLGPAAKYDEEHMLRGLAAALAANFGLWSLLVHTQLSFLAHPQLWLVPLALIVLAAEHINRDRLSTAQCLTLRYLAGADYETIQMQMGLSNGSLRGLLHRGMKLLRAELAKVLGEAFPPREDSG